MSDTLETDPFLTSPVDDAPESPKPRAPWLSPPIARPLIPTEIDGEDSTSVESGSSLEGSASPDDDVLPEDGASPDGNASSDDNALPDDDTLPEDDASLEDIFEVDDEQPAPEPSAETGETHDVDPAGTVAQPAVPELVRLAAETERFNRHLALRDMLQPSVDRLLSLMSNDPALRTLSGRLVLTRDHAIDASQLRTLSDAIRPKLTTIKVDVSTPKQVDQLIDIVYDELTGISVLGDLWRDDSVDEICVDAWDRVTVERHGRLERTAYRFRSPEHAASIARHLSQKVSDRPISNANPLVTAQLPQARVQFVYGALTATGLSITIRKFRALMGMDALLDVGALNDEMRDFLADAVRARATIVVSGGTGTGKTTAINALSEFIPDSERVITIEDSFELQLANTHVVSLQAKVQSSSDDAIVITLADLLVASLRMRPDRIIVGEVREPNAASVMFDAANTGHDGALTTIHADTPTSALNARLSALLVRAPNSGFSERTARVSIAQAVQVVVHIARQYGRRYISEIALVDPAFLGDGTDSLIAPHTLFRAHVERDGDDAIIDHRRIGSVGADTQLAMRFSNLPNIDPQRWTT